MAADGDQQLADLPGGRELGSRVLQEVLRPRPERRSEMRIHGAARRSGSAAPAPRASLVNRPASSGRLSSQARVTLVAPIGPSALAFTNAQPRNDGSATRSLCWSKTARIASGVLIQATAAA